MFFACQKRYIDIAVLVTLVKVTFSDLYLLGIFRHCFIQNPILTTEASCDSIANERKSKQENLLLFWKWECNYEDDLPQRLPLLIGFQQWPLQRNKAQECGFMRVTFHREQSQWRGTQTWDTILILWLEMLNQTRIFASLCFLWVNCTAEEKEKVLSSRNIYQN